MSQNISLVFLRFFLLAIVAYLIFLLWAFLRERQALAASWKMLSHFEKYSLQIGIVVFFFMPLLASHPAKDSYLPKVLSEILSELGKALFIFGVIALLQRLHELNKKQ